MKHLNTCINSIYYYKNKKFFKDCVIIETTVKHSIKILSVSLSTENRDDE